MRRCPISGQYWRRHKHELEGDRDEIAAPAPPSKRARYTREDDVLLAQFFATKRFDDSQDNLFRLFASKVGFREIHLSIVRIRIH